MRVVALAGGVGGAKLAFGLQRLLGPNLSVVVNTGDDFERHGLLVCPDHDTVLYTLAGIANRELGWGIEGETWTVIEQLGRFGEETWFRLGDRDLATHIVRMARLQAGQRLTEISLHLQRSLGVAAQILPMADEPVRTWVRSNDTWLAFQEYFVRLHQEPTIHEVRFDGADAARPTPEVSTALNEAAAIVICPSNPLVSIAPILAVPGMTELIETARRRGVRVVAVSPIVGGKALKGPADRMLASAGHEVSPVGVARLYRDLVDGFVLDAVDAALAPQLEQLGIRALVADTVMSDDTTRIRLAERVLEFSGQLAAV